MRKVNIPILTLLISITIGIVLYDYFKTPAIIVWVCSLLLSLTGVLFNTYSSKKIIGSALFMCCTSALFITIGYLSRTYTDDTRSQTHYTHTNTEGSYTLLVKINRELKPTLYQHKYLVDLKGIDSTITTGKLLLNIYKDSATILPKTGEWWYARTALLPVPHPKNPYQFDYGAYLNKQEIYRQVSAKPQEMLRASKETYDVSVWASRFRERVKKSLHHQSFTPRQLAVIEALVLGQRQGIDKEMSSQYAAAGMMHILAVSGLHVGVILLILRFLFGFIKWRQLQWVKSLLIISLIWSFAIITGLSPSVLRAATMFSFLEVGELLGGKRKSQDAVLASAIFLLLLDPLLIYQVGFQLSYLAVIAILWMQPWLASFWSPELFILRKLRDVVFVTIAAQLGVMPLSLFYFHQFPGLFIISNVLIIPFLGLILGGGLLACFLSVTDLLPEFIAQTYGGIIDVMNNYIAWVAGQEDFVARHISVSATLMILVYIFMITTLLLCMKYSKRRLIVASLATIILTSFIVLENNLPDSQHLAILNRSTSTTLTQLQERQLTVFNNDSLYLTHTDSRVKAYQDALKIDTVVQKSYGNYFRFKRKEILIVDSLSIYNLEEANPDFVILTHSPKVNMKRLIERYPNCTIVADGSNYHSYISRWKATCTKQKIPFHSTYEKGAFIID